jgi:hypothetical protein
MNDAMDTSAEKLKTEFCYVISMVPVVKAFSCDVQGKFWNNTMQPTAI